MIKRDRYLPSLANFGTMRFSIIFYDVLLTANAKDSEAIKKVHGFWVNQLKN